MAFRFYSKEEEKELLRIYKFPQPEKKKALEYFAREKKRSLSGVIAKMYELAAKDKTKPLIAVVTETIVEIPISDFELISRDGQTYLRLKIKK